MKKKIQEKLAKERITRKKVKIAAGEDGLSMAILLEDINAKYDGLIEGHGATDERLDRIESKLDATVEMVGSLATDVSILKTDVGTLKTDVGSLATDVSILKTDVGTLKTDVGSLTINMEIVKQDIEIIKGGMRKKIEVEEFSALERRVLVLEHHHGADNLAARFKGVV